MSNNLVCVPQDLNKRVHVSGDLYLDLPFKLGSLDMKVINEYLKLVWLNGYTTALADCMQHDVDESLRML